MTAADGLFAEFYRDAKAALSRNRGRRLGLGSLVCIRAADGSLLRLEDGTGHLVGGQNERDDSAQFYIVGWDTPYANRPSGCVRMGDRIGFRSRKNGRFVGVNFDDGSVLTCWGDHLKEWELFSVGSGGIARRASRTVRYGSEVSLRIKATWRGDEDRFVQYRRDTSRLCRANVQHVDTWETFTFFNPLDV